ncbi:MAG: LamG domain-containing protein, partial [Bacteroidia bacterium]
MKNSILLFLLLFAFSFTKAQVPNQGLVYSYTFYKSFTNDGSASGHPSNNGSDFRKDRCFVDSGALTFDGINDYVRLDKMDSIDLGSFTMSVWFKSGSGKSRYESIMNMLNGGGDNTGFSFEINRGSGTSFKEGNLNFYLRDKTGKALSLVVVDPSANDCEWHHVCWVVDNSSTNTSRIYVDGTLRTPLPGYSAQSPS